MGTLDLKAAQDFLTKGNNFLNGSGVRYDWLGFLDLVANQESAGQGGYAADNHRGYIGMYQEGTDTQGNLKYDQFFAGIGGQLFGVTTPAQFLVNPIAQELDAISEFSGTPTKVAPQAFNSDYRAALIKFANLLVGDNPDLTLDQAKTYAANIFNQITDPTQSFNITYTGSTFSSNNIKFTQAGISAAAHNLGAPQMGQAMYDIFTSCYSFDRTTGVATHKSTNPTNIVEFSVDGFSDGNGVPFSAWVGLFQSSSWDISPLLNASNANGLADFNSLAKDLISYRKDQILAYLTTNKQPISMSINSGGTDYSGTINSILSGLGLPTSQLGSITGKVILTSGDYSDASSNVDLIIGLGSETLTGGTGNDTFVFVPPASGSAIETINDSRGNGSGSIFVGGTQLIGGTPSVGVGDTWTDSNGDQYQFAAASIGSNIGRLTITQGLLGSGGNQIVINNFDLSQAETNANGFLGIKFGNQLTLAASTAVNNPDVTQADQTADVPSGAAQTFTLYASAPADTPQTVTLSCSNSSSLICTGADTYSFANGPATVTIPAGQNSVTLTLIDTSTASTADTATLTATATDASGNTDTSNNLAVTFDQPNPVVTNSNFKVYSYSSGGSSVTGAYKIATGYGVFGAGGGSGDGIYGGGTSQLYANTPIDLATALAQQKTAVATGQVGEYFSIDTSLGNPNNGTIGGLGLNSAVNNPNNSTVVGSTGNDRIVIYSGYVARASAGSNTIVCGPGNNTVLAGWNPYIFKPTLTTNLDTYFAESYWFTALVLKDNDNSIVFGGKGDSQYWFSNGNNWLDAGGGNDFIRLGTGSNTIFGGSGNDTIVGAVDTTNHVYTLVNGLLATDGVNEFMDTGYPTPWDSTQASVTPTGTNHINLESGNDLVIALGGNNDIIGGTGDSTIYSGNNKTNWADSGASANNYIYSGTGNTTLYGSAGNDTLVSGSLSGSNNATVIHGGNGNDLFVAGTGNDTIFAGSGKNTYVFNAGFGSVCLNPSSANTDTISFGPGITAADLSLTLAAGDPPLLIQTSDGSSLTINGGMDGSINKFAFSDGSVLTLDQLMAQAASTPNTVAGANGNVIFGASGSASLAGGAGNDTIYAWGGNNTLIGGTGSTTFEVHSTSDVVEAQSTGTNTNSIISSASYVLPANVQSLTLTGSNDLTGAGNNLYDNMQTNSGNDTLIAGTGGGTMTGGAGSETYAFNQDSGKVTIMDTPKSVSDVISFGTGITSDAVRLAVSGVDLIVDYGTQQIASSSRILRPKARRAGRSLENSCLPMALGGLTALMRKAMLSWMSTMLAATS